MNAELIEVKAIEKLDTEQKLKVYEETVPILHTRLYNNDVTIRSQDAKISELEQDNQKMKAEINTLKKIATEKENEALALAVDNDELMTQKEELEDEVDRLNEQVEFLKSSLLTEIQNIKTAQDNTKAEITGMVECQKNSLTEIQNIRATQDGIVADVRGVSESQKAIKDLIPSELNKQTDNINAVMKTEIETAVNAVKSIDTDIIIDRISEKIDDRTDYIMDEIMDEIHNSLEPVKPEPETRIEPVREDTQEQDEQDQPHSQALEGNQLTIYEALDLPKTAKELSDLTGIATRTVYRVTDALIERNIIKSDDSSPAKFQRI